MSGGGTQTTVTQAADPWHKEQSQGLYKQGVGYLNNSPYQAYGGSTVAGFQPMQMAAQDFLSNAFLGRSVPFQAPQLGGPYSQPNTPTFQAVEMARPQFDGPPGSDSWKPNDWLDWWNAGFPGDPRGATNPQGQTQGQRPDPNGYYGSGGGGGSGAGTDWRPPGFPTASAMMASPSDPYAQMRAYGVDPANLAAPDLWRPPSGAAPMAASAQMQTTAAPSGYPADWQTQRPGPYSLGDPIWLDSWGPPPPSMYYGAPGGGYVQRTPGDPNPIVDPIPGGTPPGSTYQPPPVSPPPPGVVLPPPITPPTPSLPGNATGMAEAFQASDIARGIAQGGASPQVGASSVAGGNLLGGLGMYRDPYEGQVVNQALGDLDRSRQLAQGQNASLATMSGAFGGDRSAILEAETNRGYADAAARTAAQLRSQGFTQAANLAQSDASRGLTAGMANQGAGLQSQLANQAAWFQGRGQQLQGAGLLSSFGGDVHNRALGTAQALSSVGAEQQGMAQDMIGGDYAQWQEAQNDPYKRFGFLQGMLTGVPQGMSQTSYVPGNRGAGFLGGALAGGGIGAGLKIGGATGNPLAALIGGGLGGLLGLL